MPFRLDFFFQISANTRCDCHPSMDVQLYRIACYRTHVCKQSSQPGKATTQKENPISSTSEVFESPESTGGKTPRKVSSTQRPRHHHRGARPIPTEIPLQCFIDRNTSLQVFSNERARNKSESQAESRKFCFDKNDGSPLCFEFDWMDIVFPEDLQVYCNRLQCARNGVCDSAAASGLTQHTLRL